MKHNVLEDAIYNTYKMQGSCTNNNKYFMIINFTKACGFYEDAYSADIIINFKILSL